jgi:hypothetical protein
MLTISDVMKMKERRDIDCLIQALQDQDIGVRAEAASSLGQLGDEKAVIPLISALQDDSDPYVRSLAARALGFLGDPRAKEALMNALTNDALEVGVGASNALVNVVGAAVRRDAALRIVAASRRTEAKEVSQTDESLITEREVPATGEKPRDEIQAQESDSQSGTDVEQLIKEDKEHGEKEDSNKIGGVDIVWVANRSAASQFMSLAKKSGLSLREAISMVMGMSGSRDELLETDYKIILLPDRKAWCETTPIYRDKVGGGIYVMFEKLDEDICNERGLELLGTIDPKIYAAALCKSHGLNIKNLTV